MTEQDLKYQDLKREYEALKKENERLRFSNSLLEKQLKEQKDHIGDVSKMVVTNADRIRNMSDEELAEFIPIGFDCVCNPNYECIETVIVHGECGKQKECLMKWLKEKVE